MTKQIDTRWLRVAARAKKMRDQGYSNPAIAKELGFTRSWIWSKLGPGRITVRGKILKETT